MVLRTDKVQMMTRRPSANRFLTRVMLRLRSMRPSSWDPAGNLRVPNLYFEETRLNDKPYLIPIYVLKTPPCSWFVKCGGCTVCGYQWAVPLTRTPSDEDVMAQIAYVIKRTPPKKYPLVTVTSAGSFLDDTEIRPELRRRIIRSLKGAGYKFFNFECRPDVICRKSDEELEELARHFETVSTGLGLESSSDFIRINTLNKGFRTEAFEEAIKRLREHGIVYDVYVLLGKPFLTERENIEDAYRTVMYSFRMGAFMAIIMVANLQPFTLSYWLWERGLYKLPSLWSAIEVVRRLPEKYRERVIIKGMYRAVPEPAIYAKTCNRCVGQVVDAINRFNLTGDYGHLEELESVCSCRDKWEEEVRNAEPLDERKLKERLMVLFKRISSELFDGSVEPVVIT